MLFLGFKGRQFKEAKISLVRENPAEQRATEITTNASAMLIVASQSNSAVTTCPVGSAAQVECHTPISVYPATRGIAVESLVTHSDATHQRARHRKSQRFAGYVFAPARPVTPLAWRSLNAHRQRRLRSCVVGRARLPFACHPAALWHPRAGPGSRTPPPGAGTLAFAHGGDPSSGRAQLLQSGPQGNGEVLGAQAGRPRNPILVYPIALIFFPLARPRDPKETLHRCATTRPARTVETPTSRRKRASADPSAADGA
jgi:hypothetical protein